MKGKKGIVIILMSVGMLAVLAVILLANTNASYFRVDVGQSYAELVKTTAISQNIVNYVEDSAELSVEESIIRLSANGGYTSSNPTGCQTANLASKKYVIWNSGDGCYPSESQIKRNFESVFLLTFERIADSFPTIEGTEYEQGTLTSHVFLDADVSFSGNQMTLVGAPTYFLNPSYIFDEETDELTIIEKPAPDFLLMQGENFEFPIYPFFSIARNTKFISEFSTISDWAKTLNVQSCFSNPTPCESPPNSSATFSIDNIELPTYGFIDVTTDSAVISFALS
tara:strand:- start:5523 stop:6371 length:849 start_codon:yes stop_codon:yes gene_type:complete